MLRHVCSVVVALLVSVSVARAQIPGCGGANPKTDIWQQPDYRRGINGYSQLTRNTDGCSIKLRIEAWVEGIAMNVMVTESWGPAAAMYYSIPVPEYGSWTAVAKNWLILTGYGWNFYGWSSDTTDVVPRPPDYEEPPADDPPAEEEEPLDMGGPGCVASPILIDTGRNGYKLTDVSGGVQFDLDADGIPEQVSWTHQDSDEAFLALDRNGNGRIDDGSELFGNNTPVYPQIRQLTAANGFDALAFLESPDYGRAAADSLLDGRDEVFGRLLLWTDRNHNGVSEPDELQVAADAGLAGIDTFYKEKARKRDQHGNEFRQKGTVYWADGAAVCYDVWLRVQ